MVANGLDKNKKLQSIHILKFKHVALWISLLIIYTYFNSFQNEFSGKNI